MPAPASVDELLELIHKSGVADDARLKSYVQQQTAAGTLPADPSKVAGQLVRDGLLTYFQAEQLLQGKWKRFSIGKYRVLERIGSGGMGQVFLCEHKMMRRRVAVKVLPTAKAEDQASLKRFHREAQAVAAVDHPNLVRAYDLDEDDNLHFLVMEYVDGTNLQDLVKKSGPLDPVRACHYVYGAAVGLQHAHTVGLVHRDIKPGNVLIDRSGVVKILDMGLARFFHDDDDNITRKYDENILGTADYLAPEQAEDSHTVDIRADIYSLGATFYYLLTGHAPFPDGTIPQKLFAHKNRDPKPVREVRPEVPEGVAAAAAAMMAKDPAKRPQTPADVMDLLAPWVATPIPPPEDRELPQLSPAATGPGGAPRAAPAPRTFTSGVPVAFAPGSGAGGLKPAPDPAPGLTAVAAPAAPPAGHAIWEALASETANNAQADTGRAPAPGEAPPAPPAAPARRRAPWVLAAGGLAALAAAGGVAAYVAFRPPTAPPPTSAPGPRQLLVWKSAPPGTEHVFPTLRQALGNCAAGDTISVREERLAEGPLKVGGPRHKDSTIESGRADGHPVLVEFVPPPPPAAPVMLELVQADGVRVRGLDLDGKGQADVGVRVSGTAAGVVVESVTVRGARQAAVRLTSPAGDPGRPLTFDRCRFVLPPAAAGIEVVSPNPQLVARHVRVAGTRFEGPGKAALRVETAATDFAFEGNRVYQTEAGVVFGGKVPDDLAVKVQISRNTFYGVKDGLRFDLPTNTKARHEVAAAQNYFARTGAVARAAGPQPGPLGFTATDNARDKPTRDGNVPVQVTAVENYDLPNPDPADDARFLFPPADGPLAAVGPNKLPVGAPTK